MKPLPSIERLNELYLYDSNTGIVTRKVRNNRYKAGSIVGTIDRGYVCAFIDYKKYKLHRIVWKLHTGNDPYPYEIDHINRKRDDNRIVNLRLVSGMDNMANQGIRCNNTTGYKGVCKRGNRYDAKVTRNKKTYYFGTFDTPEEAHKAIIESEVYNT